MRGTLNVEWLVCHPLRLIKNASPCIIDPQASPSEKGALRLLTLPPGFGQGLGVGGGQMKGECTLLCGMMWVG